MSGGGPGQDTGVRWITVTNDVGQRIDNFLLRELKGIPRSRVYRILRKGEVRVNGGRVKPTYRLVHGDRVRVPPVRLPSPGDPAPAFIGDTLLRALEAAVLFEDDALMVINKPSGLAAHGGSGLSFGAVEALRRLRPEADVALAHRLDRDTSGVLLVAKSRPMLLALNHALRERSVKKRYRAIVFGAWPARTTSVNLSLKRYLTPSGERRVRVAAEGKASRTDFRILAAGGPATLLEARLHTGRTHQIRVHTSASGHPVVGDAKYSSDAQQALAAEHGVHRLCLHAEELAVILDGRRRRFRAPVPEDFDQAWQAMA